MNAKISLLYTAADKSIYHHIQISVIFDSSTILCEMWKKAFLKLFFVLEKVIIYFRECAFPSTIVYIHIRAGNEISNKLYQCERFCRWIWFKYFCRPLYIIFVSNEMPYIIFCWYIITGRHSRKKLGFKSEWVLSV